MEDAEGTSDVFVKARIGRGTYHETDTHWRCSTGTASFNYRLNMDFEAPNKEFGAYNLELKVYDRDLFKSNDFICKFNLDLSLLVDDVRLTQKRFHLSHKYYTSYL